MYQAEDGFIQIGLLLKVLQTFFCDVRRLHIGFRDQWKVCNPSSVICDPAFLVSSFTYRDYTIAQKLR